MIRFSGYADIDYIVAVLGKRVPLIAADIVITSSRADKPEREALGVPTAIAIVSAMFGVPVASDVCAFGLLAPDGSLQVVPHMGRRAEFARRAGYRTIIGPPPSTMEEACWSVARTLDEALRLAGVLSFLERRQ